MTDTQRIAYKLCDCSKCDRVESCPYKYKYIRLPREVAYGAWSLCPKIKNVRF